MDIMHDFWHTSQLQFGLKAKHGCRDAISMLYNTVEYYTLNGSTVNIVCIDLSKAFDKVNLYGLAVKLMNRNVPKVLLSVVLDWYRNISVRVRWNETSSSPRKLRSNVRQGGILSPTLFSIDVNDILTQLQAFQIGCFVASKHVGALMYADDLLLVSITLTGIQAMIAFV
jgi:Reverse transcriptase (RNA-dependent DNA polymerase)